MLDVIILAGTQTTKKWNEAGNKALFYINGRMMIEYVIDALKAARDIGKIITVGPKGELEEHLKGKVDAVIDANGSIMDNILTGVDYLGHNRHLLICSSDIPMLTTEAVNDFIEKCSELEADLCYPILEKRTIEVKYPGSTRTYVKVKEGMFTGGNIFYVNPLIIKESYNLAVRLLDARKQPFRMARILGIGFLLGLITGALSISKIEKKFSKIVNVKGRAVISNYPEIGNDGDKPDDVEMAKTYLSQQA